MKKYYTTAKYKKINSFKINLSLKKKRRKNIAKINNENRVAQSKEIIQRREIVDLKKRYEVIIDPPNNFSLIAETESFNYFISRIQQTLSERKSLFIDLIELKKLDKSSIIVLLAAMVRFRSEKINFNGSIPLNPKIVESFKHSGFFDTLYMNYEFNNNFVVFSGTKDFIARGYNLADLSKALPLIKESSIHIWGHKKRIPSLYNTIGELMKNTHEHADKSRPGHWNWWISVLLMDNKKVGFSFVDFGDGIIESLYNNTDYIEYLLERKATDQAKIFEEIISGKIQKSGTREDHRGNGLNSIYSSFKNGDLCKLIIISNSLKLELNSANDSLHESISRINNQLKGTYIYWEIDKNTKFLNSL